MLFKIKNHIANWWAQRTQLEKFLVVMLVINQPLLAIILETDFLCSGLSIIALVVIAGAPTIAYIGLGFFACALAYRLVDNLK